MGKLSISMDDDLVAELKESAGDNVSRFVAGAVRRQLDRQQLRGYLDELEEKLGPPTADEMARAATLFDRAEAAQVQAARVRRTSRRPA